MKKLLALLFASACLAGCGTAAQQSELWEHDSLYKNWDHMSFSMGGHKEVSPAEAKKSVEEGWWGKETTVRAQGK